MRRREKVKANKGRLLALVLGVLATATSFADRTANQGWVRENFVSRTNEWKLAERRHALFLIDLNAENGGKWRAFDAEGGDDTARHCERGSEIGRSKRGRLFLRGAAVLPSTAAVSGGKGGLGGIRCVAWQRAVSRADPSEAWFSPEQASAASRRSSATFRETWERPRKQKARHGMP